MIRVLVVSMFLLFLRMFGLFLVIPVFSAGALAYQNATDVWVGIAMGSYGLMQALMQLPMGWLAERLSLRIALITGLGLFVVGSLWAYTTSTIHGLVGARLLQGMGAIAGPVMGWLTTAVPDRWRARAYMLQGMAVGAGIFTGLIAGPWLYRWLGFRPLFLLLAGAGVLSLALVMYGVRVRQPTSFSLPHAHAHARTKIYHLLPYLLMTGGSALLMQFLFYGMPRVFSTALRQIYGVAMVVALFGYPILTWFERRGKYFVAVVFGWVLFVLGAGSGVNLLFEGISWWWLAGCTALTLLGYSMLQPVVAALLARKGRVLIHMSANQMAMSAGAGAGGIVAGWLWQWHAFHVDGLVFGMLAGLFSLNLFWLWQDLLHSQQPH